VKTIVALGVVVLSASCSTIDRRTYYEPLADERHVSGPDSPACGWANFGGAPDTYEGILDGHQIRVSANQDFHPYLWGPWFASVLPVFPITWIVDAFIGDSMKVWVASNDLRLEPLSQAHFIAKIGDREITGTSALLSEHYVKVVFPIEDSDVDDFLLIVNQADKRLLEVPFRRAARWAWTQWTPNC
jgi:hypothetical protein